jgi:hypothetical protein
MAAGAELLLASPGARCRSSRTRPRTPTASPHAVAACEAGVPHRRHGRAQMSRRRGLAGAQAGEQQSPPWPCAGEPPRPRPCTGEPSPPCGRASVQPPPPRPRAGEPPPPLPRRGRASVQQQQPHMGTQACSSRRPSGTPLRWTVEGEEIEGGRRLEVEGEADSRGVFVHT